MDILEIIAAEGTGTLARAFRFIARHNKSNDAPYHGLHHMLRIAYFCNEGAEYHSTEITEQNWRNLIVAALFHDFNHSQGKLPDDINIELAIKGLGEWYKSNAYNQEYTDLDVMISIIEATEYPYVISSKELSLLQGIIRDADLMVGRDPDWINTMIIGLGKEMGDKSFIEMAAGQLAFHESIQMNTNWGKYVYSNEWGQIFTNLEILRSLL